MLDLLLAVHERLEIDTVSSSLWLVLLYVGRIKRLRLAIISNFLILIGIFLFINLAKSLDRVIRAPFLFRFHSLYLLRAKNVFKAIRILKLKFLTVKTDGGNELDARTSVNLHRIDVEGLHLLCDPAKPALEEVLAFFL